jgi:hypothetical protein
MPSAVMDAAAAMATNQLSFGQSHSTGSQGLSPELDSNQTLAEITLSAQHLTVASGAALVLSDGQSMSCRSCCGDLAPPVGTRLNTDTGFTASCVRTGEVVRCDDTQTDPRVDTSSCVELGIRSILAVPVFDGQNVAGVLEVLSNKPDRFTDRHATALKLLARLVETLANYGPRSDVRLDTPTPVPKPQGNDPTTANMDEARVTCLSCGHPNPQDSQFCNRCGVILLVDSGTRDATLDRSFPEGIEASSEQDLKEIHKVISESAGLATWNEIYAKLLTSMQTISAQDNPHTVTKEEASRRDDAVLGFGKTQGDPELKARLTGSVRRSLWL